MKLPRLLDGSMNELARLNPTRLSATMNLQPLSTATMSLPPGDPAVRVRQWVELYGPDGSLGVFRVASTRRVAGGETEVNLEHGLTTLEDCITPSGVTVVGSVEATLTTLLGYQAEKVWEVGTVEAPADVTVGVEVTEALCLQAVLDIMSQAEGYALAFDQSKLPWKLNVVKMPDVPSCECRLGRNAQSVAISMEDSELVTRAVSAMLPGGYLDGPTVGDWGVISRGISIAEDTPEADAIAEAEAYLDKHKHPRIAVEIEAQELCRRTGEPLDRFRLGAMVRCALPDISTTVEERLVSIYYGDILNEPDAVTLSLSTVVQDASTAVAAAEKEAKGASGSSKINKEQLEAIAKEVYNVTNGVTTAAALSCMGLNAYGLADIASLVVAGATATWKTITVDGVSVKVLANE